MQNNIDKTIFYSSLFAIGGAPTIAMLIIKLQHIDAHVMYSVFISLTVISAIILIPMMLIQNGYLLLKRKDKNLDQKIEGLMKAYFTLNVACLIFWLSIQFIK